MGLQRAAQKPSGQRRASLGAAGRASCRLTVGGGLVHATVESSGRDSKFKDRSFRGWGIGLDDN
jgi:hypothetical protein